MRVWLFRWRRSRLRRRYSWRPLRRLFDTSIGRVLIDLPERRFRPASYAIFDPTGRQIGGGKWVSKSQIAWALSDLADMPEDEANAIEASTLAEWQGGRFADPPSHIAKRS